MYVLPDHAAYERCKYETTADFGDLRRDREEGLLERALLPDAEVAAGDAPASARLSGDGSVADWGS